MNFLKNLFSKKARPVHSYEDFWNWFRAHERTFHHVVKKNRNIEKEFFNKLSQKLNDLKDGFFYLTGMFDAQTVELVLTADANVKNIAFVEELVASAPSLPGWKFTACKPAVDVKDVYIQMEGYTFSQENMHFYSNDNEEYPDEIDITIVHEDLTKINRRTIVNGIYIFLENFLGELGFATTVDNIQVVAPADAQKELIPIEKLPGFLTWRQKEFVEKYEGVRHNTENDQYAGFETELQNGRPLIAIINTDLLQWDGKASHPWILHIEIKYDGSNHNGLPDKRTYAQLDEIENVLLRELKDFEGYLNIGRQTADDTRDIYFACKDFRRPSKVLHAIEQTWPGPFRIDYDIYKDKYWQSFNRFQEQEV